MTQTLFTNEKNLQGFEKNSFLQIRDGIVN